MKTTKKIVLLGTLGASVLFIFLGLAETKFGLDCSYQTNEKTSEIGAFIPGGNGERYPNEIYWVRAEWCEPLAFTLIPFLPIFLFSLVTYKMREEVFRAWFNFTKWWVPISIFLILITPDSSGGSFGIPNVFDKGFLAFILAALFFIISLVIIVRKSLKLRGK